MPRHAHREDDEISAAELMLRIEGRVTELAELLNGHSLNHVLFVGTVLLDASGQWTISFRVPFGSVSVNNPSAAVLTVANRTPDNVAPVSGRGVVVVAANGHGTWNVAGTTLTLYGTPGAQAVLEVMATPGPVAL